MVTYTFNPLYHDAPQPKVYLKDHWGDSWVAAPFLYCDFCEKTSNPTISQAQFSWRYGELLQPGAISYVSYPRQTLIGKYVKVVIDNPADTQTPYRWYGTIEELREAPAGSPRKADTSQVPTGQQVFIAFGFEFLLARVFLTEAYYRSSGGSVVRVARPLVFNEENQHANLGNRSASLGPDGAYLFAHNLYNAAQRWSTYRIIQYLLAYHQPRGPTGGVLVPFTLDAGAATCLPIADRPRITMKHRSVKSLLDQLMDRRRILGYTVEVPLNESSVVVRPFSFNQSVISYEGEVIQPNPNQKPLDVRDCPDVEHFPLRETAADRFDQVVAIGDRIVTCFTVSGLDGTLARQWTDAEEELYDTAARGAADYSSCDLVERQARNEHFRSQDLVQRTYAYFGLAESWNLRVSNGEASSTTYPYLPTEGSPDVPLPLYFPEARLERFLPLRANHDYTGTRIASGTVLNNNPVGVAFEYLPTIVLAKLPDASLTYAGLTRYQHLDHFGSAGNMEILGPTYKANVRLQEEAPGIVVRVEPYQHLIAVEDFSPPNNGDGSNDDADGPGAVDLAQTLKDDYGAIDWHNNLLITVAMKADDHVQARYPDIITPGPAELSRILKIELGDEAQVHYVVPQTVVGINDGVLQRTTSGGYLRDDRLMLQSIARFAYEWYATPRRIVGLLLRRVVHDFAVGDLITTADGLTVNTCVTRLRHVFTEVQSDRPPPPYTEIETAFAALDGRAFHGVFQ